jgi:hypothetical protein
MSLTVSAEQFDAVILDMDGVLTLLQRWVLRERDHTARNQRRRQRDERKLAEVTSS